MRLVFFFVCANVMRMRKEERTRKTCLQWSEQMDLKWFLQNCDITGCANERLCECVLVRQNAHFCHKPSQYEVLGYYDFSNRLQ